MLRHFDPQLWSQSAFEWLTVLQVAALLLVFARTAAFLVALLFVFARTAAFLVALLLVAPPQLPEKLRLSRRAERVV
jgi:hypothetical protein